MVPLRKKSIKVWYSKAQLKEPFGTLFVSLPRGPCTQIVYTLGPMYLYREYFKAKVYPIPEGPTYTTIMEL